MALDILCEFLLQFLSIFDKDFKPLKVVPVKDDLFLKEPFVFWLPSRQ